MKCISLWQPWATLWVSGQKIHETRSWAMSHRGDLAVQASKKWTPELRAMCYRPEFLRALRRNEGDATTAMFERLERSLGCIVGIVRVTDCKLITIDNAPPHPDRDFGDYTPGRYMIRADNFRPLDTPIPYKGAQGLFEIPDSTFDDAWHGSHLDPTP